MRQEKKILKTRVTFFQLPILRVKNQKPNSHLISRVQYLIKILSKDLQKYQPNLTQKNFVANLNTQTLFKYITCTAPQ